MADNSPQQTQKGSPVDDIKGKIASVSSEKRWAMSCYIPVIGLLTCVLASVKMVNSKFCLFHARQGLTVFAIWVLATFIGFISPTLSLMLLGIFLALCIAGMVIAYGGKQVGLPILGQFAGKIPEYYIFKLLTGKIPEQMGEDGLPKDSKVEEPSKSDAGNSAPAK